MHIDDEYEEEYKDLIELYRDLLSDTKLSHVDASKDWKMCFYVPNVVTFEGRRYRLCEDVKPDYLRGFGFAFACPLDAKENAAGFIRCVRLKFTPAQTVKFTDVACGREESNEWYDPENDDYIEDMDD